MMDQPTTDISRYFYIAAKFIENAVNSGGEFSIAAVRSTNKTNTECLSQAMVIEIKIGNLFLGNCVAPRDPLSLI